jgi:hypothetical protein
MMKERIAAIIIGLIMIMSMAGFALVNIIPQDEPVVIPSILDRQLTPEERLFVLRTGRVLIENFYPPGCGECRELGTRLKGFAQAFGNFVVLEDVVLTNATEADYESRMIGREGMIRDIPSNITDDGLMDLFCSLAISRPKECLLTKV